MGAALAGALVGLLGVDGGILWFVGGVWVVRRAWSRRTGVAWGIACATAGLRWGTTSLAGVGAATRLLGPTLASGPVLAVAGSALAFAAALVDEAAGDGLRARSLPERLASVMAILGLGVLYAVPGWGSSAPFGLDENLAWLVSAGWWFAAAAALAGLALGGSRLAMRVPAWVPPLVAVGGAVLVGAGR